MGSQLSMECACCSQEPEALKTDEIETYLPEPEEKEKQSPLGSSYSEQNETEASTPSNLTSIQSDGSIYTGEM